MPSTTDQKKKSDAESSDFNRQDWMCALTMIFSGMAVVLASSYLAFNDRLSVLQPSDRTSALKSMSTFSGKIEFASKYWILPAVWMYLNLHIVMNSRRAAKAANPLAGNEDKIQVSKNVLSNTVEQLVLTIILQITSLHYLTPVQVLNIVPLFNALFLIGRILFWIGYPKRRSLGFALNITPCLIMVLFAGYQFTVRHLDLNTVSLFNLKL